MASPHKSTELRTLGRDGAALVKRIASGDESAFATLYDATSPLLFGVALRIVGSAGVAEDVLCAAYAQACRRAAEYDGGREAPLTWLVMITRRLAIDRLRSGKQDYQRPEMFDPAADICTTINGKVSQSMAQHREISRVALDTLSLEERNALELSFYSGLNCREVAAQLDIPVSEARTRMRSGMKKLHQQFRPLSEEQLPNTSLPKM